MTETTLEKLEREIGIIKGAIIQHSHESISVKSVLIGILNELIKEKNEILEKLGALSSKQKFIKKSNQTVKLNNEKFWETNDYLDELVFITNLMRTWTSNFKQDLEDVIKDAVEYKKDPIGALEQLQEYKLEDLIL